MRGAVLLLILTLAFGSAGLWQHRRLQRQREERALLLALAGGEVTQTSSGLLAAGQGVIVVGRPSGAEPVTPPPPSHPPQAPQSGKQETKPTPDGAPPPRPAPTPDKPLEDFVLTIQPGQSLWKIAQSHYRRQDTALLEALARYNRLVSPDALRAGQQLHLPPLEKLAPLAAPEMRESR